MVVLSLFAVFLDDLADDEAVARRLDAGLRVDVDDMVARRQEVGGGEKVQAGQIEVDGRELQLHIPGVEGRNILTAAKRAWRAAAVGIGVDAEVQSTYRDAGQCEF